MVIKNSNKDCVVSMKKLLNIVFSCSTLLATTNNNLKDLFSYLYILTII